MITKILAASFLILVSACERTGSSSVYRIRLDNRASEFSKIEVFGMPRDQLLGVVKPGAEQHWDLDPAAHKEIKVVFYKEGKVFAEGTDSTRAGVGFEPHLQGRDVLFEYLYTYHY